MVILISESRNKGHIKLDFDTSGYSSSYDGLLSVSMAYMGYNGEDGGWFITKRELADFTRQLRIVEEQRKGKATFASVGSKEGEEEFRLEIWGIDRLGHIGAKAIMRRTYYEEKGLFPAELSVIFQIDTEKFGALVKDFEGLMKQL